MSVHTWQVATSLAALLNTTDKYVNEACRKGRMGIERRLATYMEALENISPKNKRLPTYLYRVKPPPEPPREKRVALDAWVPPQLRWTIEEYDPDEQNEEAT
jgi:hypothetical protein